LLSGEESGAGQRNQLSSSPHGNAH
jgi:hypothetical protein